jgi:hypothetical protein
MTRRSVSVVVTWDGVVAYMMQVVTDADIKTPFQSPNCAGVDDRQAGKN